MVARNYSKASIVHNYTAVKTVLTVPAVSMLLVVVVVVVVVVVKLMAVAENLMVVVAWTDSQMVLETQVVYHDSGKKFVRQEYQSLLSVAVAWDIHSLTVVAEEEEIQTLEAEECP
jgi:hypothetical protein